MRAVLKGKVAVIPGGAGGIGSAIAEAFVREGARVVVVGRKLAHVRRTVGDIAARNPKGDIVGVVGDVSREKDVATLVRSIAKQYGHIDVLVNCAAIQAPIGPFISTAWREWRANIETSLFGTVLMCRAVAPLMVKRRRGSIINFSGGGSTSSRPNFSAYAVAKTGVVRFTEVLADELRSSGVSVNAVAPGAIKTSMLAEIVAAGARAGKNERTSVMKKIAEGGDSVENAAALVVFLASDASRELSGRLVSAVWDPWKTWNQRTIREIMKGDRYTLRRKT